MGKQFKSIAIIGAGISGLTCAYELKKAGFNVTVFEKNDYVGGRMATRVKDGFHFDIGADHLCNLFVEMKKYCKEFGIKWEKMGFLTYHVFKEGNIVSTRKAIDLLSKLRLALFYFKTKKGNFFNLSSYAHYDTDNGYDYMKKILGKENVEYLVDACCTTYHFHRSKSLSKSMAISLISSVMREHEKWYLHRTQEGMSALPNALAEKIHVKTNTPIKKIVAKKTGVEVTSTRKQKYDAVVLASTATKAKAMYHNPSTEQKKILNSTKYSSSISIAFKIPTKTLGTKGIIWVPFVESKIISSYVNEEMKGKDVVKQGKTLICTWLHEDFAKKIMNNLNKDIFSIVKKELVRVCPLVEEAMLENHDLQRWPEAMPKFYHGHITNVRKFMQNGQGDNNVFFCGDYLNSPWTEGALRCGKIVAKQVIASFE